MHLNKYFAGFVLQFSLAWSACAGGWVTQQPPSMATLSSAKRNNVFYVGEQPTFKVTPVAIRYEVRDYFGSLVNQGTISGTDSPLTFTVNVSNPGWYKLYLYGAQDQGSPWGHVVGGTNFVVFRNNANFPVMPALGTSGGGRISDDEVARSVTGMGPQRLAVQDAGNPNAAIASLEQEIAIDRALYLPHDPMRARSLLVAFPNGTQNTAGVQQIVEHFKNDVKYWEGRNEPNYAYSGTAFVNNEARQFYQTVKAVDAGLQVLGPAVVSIDPGQAGWINDFLQAGGANYIDGFSFHAYNCVLGDWWLIRTSLNSLKSRLAASGRAGLPLWQTEQGYMAAVYGAYQPRLQGRWTMLQMMGYEQFGIPKEHNHLWYDVSHGFWDQPMWWENDDGSLNPAAPLMRVWSEELYGLRFAQAFDFGAVDNDLYVGDLFTGNTKSVAAFMTAGNPYGSVNLTVSSGDHVHIVSAFGVESDLAVTAGKVTLPVSELPVYVELQQGQTCQVIPRTYGQNLARQTGVVVTASGASTNPIWPNAPNDPGKLVNGQLENWYWTFADAEHPWMSNASSWPATVEFNLPAPSSISDVVIQAATPWQLDGTLLDYELQFWNGSAWQTIEHVTEPTKTWNVYSPTVRCSLDSFFSDRCVFEHHFPAITTDRIRLLVYNVTFGGGATADVGVAGGQTGTNQITLREVSIFQAPAVAPVIIEQPASQVVAPGGSATLHVGTDASASAVYRWSKDGVEIQSSSSPSLSIINASADTEGNYSVNVVDAGWTTASNPALVLLDTPINNWIVRYFPQTQARDIASLLSKATDGDGVSNLQKYYFDLAPGAPAKLQNLPQAYLEGQEPTQYFTLSYLTNPAASDVQATVESCADLAPNLWIGATPDLVESTPSGQPDGAVVTRFKFLTTGRPTKLFRIRLLLSQGSSQPQAIVKHPFAPRKSAR